MSAVALNRTTFRTSRLLEFAPEKELIAQTGHEPDAWPVVILKELVDNAVDAAEEAGTPPVITVTVDRTGIIGRGQRPGHPGRRGRGHPRLQRPGLVARGIRQPDPRRAGQRAQDDRRHAVRAGRRNAAGSRSRRGAQRHNIDFGVDRIRQRADRRAPRRCRRRQVGTRVHGRVAGFSLLNPRRGEGSVFTNRQSVRLAEPAPDDHGRLVRRTLDGGGDRPGMVQVEALGPDLAALVHRRRISSAWSPPTSPTIPIAGGCAPCASW